MSDTHNNTRADDIEMQNNAGNQTDVSEETNTPAGPRTDPAQDAREWRDFNRRATAAIAVTAMGVGVAVGYTIGQKTSDVGKTPPYTVTSTVTVAAPSTSNTGASGPTQGSAADSSATPTLTYVVSTSGSTDGTQAPKHD